MRHHAFNIRNAHSAEFYNIGQLMVRAYSRLENFPTQAEQPEYYRLLENVGELTTKPGTELLVAISSGGEIAGAVVYFAEMKYYGSGGTAIREKNAAGFRLLAVDEKYRGLGIGKRLTAECIRKATEQKQSTLIIHTTMSMQAAWKMYEGMGFRRSPDLDFIQASFPVYGFRLIL